MTIGRAGIIGILILVMLVEVPQGAKGTPSWGLDGIGSGANAGIACQGTCIARYLTTAHANDLIILVANCDGCTTGQISSITDSSGLTYTQRANYADPNPIQPGYFRIWEYYAVARSPLSSDNVTVAWKGINGMNRMQVFAVHGYGREHFDVPSPVTMSSGSCVGLNLGTCSAALGTSGKDFVFAYLATPDIAPCSLAPGWTNIYGDGWSEIDYLVLKAPSPAVQFDCNSIEVPSAILMDAILLQPT